MEDDASHLESRGERAKCPKKFLTLSVLLGFSLEWSKDVIAARVSFAANF